MKEGDANYQIPELTLPLSPIEELRKQVRDLADENNLSVPKRAILSEYANLSFRSRTLISDFIYAEKPNAYFELARDESGKKRHFLVTKKAFEKTLFSTITRKQKELDKKIIKSNKLKKLKPKVLEIVIELSPLPLGLGS